MVDFNPGVKTTKLDGNGTQKTTVNFHEGDEVKNKPSLWNIVEEYDYNGDGKVDEMLIQEYDENQKLINSERRKYEYNDSGKITYESYDIGDDGSIEHDVTWEYDSQGRVIKRTDGGTDGKRSTTIQYTNDGRIVDHDIDGDDTTDLRTVEDGNVTIHYRKDSNGKLVYDGESRYGRNKNGAIIGDHYNKDGYSHSTGPNSNKSEVEKFFYNITFQVRKLFR